MADYTKIIADIHGGNASGHIVDEHNYITIDPKTRQLILPSDFNSTIAYAGDINSQIVEFLCPKTYDGHSLRDCSNHEIRWYNTGSGVGDTSELTVGENVDEYFVLSWLLPPEALTKDGQLQIVISIFDYNQEKTYVSEWVPAGNYVKSTSGVEQLGSGEYRFFENNNESIDLIDGYYTLKVKGEFAHCEFTYNHAGDMDWDGPITVWSGEEIYISSNDYYDPEFDTRRLPCLYNFVAGDSNVIELYVLEEIPIYHNKDTIKYQWNTAPFSGLSVGATLNNVDIKAPTKDKILTLNTQTRNITLPTGYNTTIATKGDIGTAFVYIQCPRYIAGMDLTSDKIKKYLGWSAGEFSGINECTVEKIYSEVEKDDLVMLTWDVDENLTTRYAGNFSFELSFKEFNEDNTILKKQWYSNSNNSLSIKATLNIDSDIIPTPAESGGVRIELDATINENILLNMLKEKFNYGGN